MERCEVKSFKVRKEIGKFKKKKTILKSRIVIKGKPALKK
jgi:hypothetical protein